MPAKTDKPGNTIIDLLVSLQAMSGRRGSMRTRTRALTGYRNR